MTGCLTTQSTSAGHQIHTRQVFICPMIYHQYALICWDQDRGVRTENTNFSNQFAICQLSMTRRCCRVECWPDSLLISVTWWLDPWSLSTTQWWGAPCLRKFPPKRETNAPRPQLTVIISVSYLPFLCSKVPSLISHESFGPLVTPQAMSLKGKLETNKLSWFQKIIPVLWIEWNCYLRFLVVFRS